MSKNLSKQYSQKLLDSAKTSTIYAIKTASKRAIQKTVETAGDLIGNKIADKITSASKEFHLKSSQKLPSQNNNLDETDIPKERCIYIYIYIYIYIQKKATNY